jgi:glutamate-1-semialdehyde 2,1-aminomutase
LAQGICQAIPFIDKIRFVNSGTEAVMGALRLCRGYTGRDTILKFEHAYHGHADYLLARGGSGLATLGIPSCAGVPRNFFRHTLVVSQARAALERVFKRYGKRLAAVIVEPVGANFGVIPPHIELLKLLRRLTRDSGVLLVFDEVITGFRFTFGSLAEVLGVIPDLVCLGKIIAAGLPIGAYGARKEIMQCLAPVGNVYQASTFSGNPLVMQVGCATLQSLSRLKNAYPRLAELTQTLTSQLQAEAQIRKIDLKVSHYASMFSLKFKYKQQFAKFYRAMLAQGIYLAPSEFEANFLSFAHTPEEVQKTICAARLALKSV